MTEERILTAIERIDGAMSRIEMAARQPVPMPAMAGVDPAQHDELSQRHHTMRGRVEAAIAELDTLIRNG